MSLVQAWRELEEQPPGPTRLVIRRLDGAFPCAVHAGLEWPERLRTVSFEVSTGAVPSRLTLPGARGFAAEIQRIAPGPGGRVRLLVRLTERHFGDVFTAFAEDVARHVAATQSEGEAVAIVASRLARWQRFFDDASTGLSLERQIGLFGELLALRDHFLPWVGPSIAIGGWGGPHGKRQDFQFASTAVEVKATTTQQHQLLPIASERQLDSTGLRRLYLAHLSLDAREGGEGLSLPGIVKELRATLAADPSSLGIFDDALLAAGYLDAQSDRYEGTRYTHRSHHFFEVRDDFPRITETDLRSGVGAVKYSIAVTACAPFVSADADVCSYIREHLDE